MNHVRIREPGDISKIRRSIQQYDFPFQFLIVLACASAIAFLFLRTSFSDQIISLLLSVVWFWTSIFFLYILAAQVPHFSLFFGIIFALEGFFILYENFFSDRLTFNFSGSPMNYTGLIFILTGLIFFPLLGGLLGRNWSEILTTGMPGPTILLTLGFLLIGSKKTPIYLLLVPDFWVFSTFFLGLGKFLPEELLIVIFTIIANIWILSQKKYQKIKNAPLE